MRQRIELRAVSKYYPAAGVLADVPLPRAISWMASKRKTAVDDVSLTVDAGERIGIIGRNGAGKTTLLKLIAGLAQPSSGRVGVHGRVTSIMTLGLAVREDLTGRENIYVEGQVQGRSRAELDAVVQEVVEFADLGDFIDYPVRTYSTGMKARLAFATATNIDPEILIIDEALSVGDAAFAMKARRAVRRLCERGRIVMIVSHSMNAVVDLCSRALWMDAGRIVLDADPITVTQRYLAAVRREDDAALAARFQGLAVARSHRPGCEIDELTIGEDGDVLSRAVITAGADALVRWSARTPTTVRDACMRLEVARLDGLVVVHSEHPLGAPAGDEHGWSGRIGMRPLVLGPGVYRFKLEVVAGSDALAERSAVVEVVATDAPRGGRCALVYPATVTVEEAG